MDCPWCGAVMEVGRFHSRGQNFYLPEDRKVTWITKRPFLPRAVSCCRRIIAA